MAITGVIRDEQYERGLLAEGFEILEEGFANFPSLTTAVSGSDRMRQVFLETAKRLQNNYPYFHPLYAGQMLKPGHPVAQLAYTLAMSINPNNHALDGGRATSAMEKEAVAEIAAMFGWKDFLGHLCGGGTMANLEALWIASQLAPGRKILASEQAHYTHERISKILQLPFEKIPCDARGRMDLQALQQRLASDDVAVVVASMGTTAAGSVDPLHKILELRSAKQFHIHADAAYGGYFALIDDLQDETKQAFSAIGEADSIAIDPHKHGLQPYGCGCVLFKDPRVGRFYKHDSPYTYFSSNDLHLGEISVECSRPGAAAAALWATQQLLPLVPGGEFANGLSKGRQAALKFYEYVKNDDRFITPFAPELDLLVFALRAESAADASYLARRTFEIAAARDLHLALVELPVSFFADAFPTSGGSRQTVTCLRSVLMKPEHLDWIDEIWVRLSAAVAACAGDAMTGKTPPPK